MTASHESDHAVVSCDGMAAPTAAPPAAVARSSAARSLAVDTPPPSGGGTPDVDVESRLDVPFPSENSLAAENARLTMLLHEQLDRTIKHTSGDLHGECSSQRRVDANFLLLCSERLPATATSHPDEFQLARMAEKQRAAEERVRRRYRERLDRRLAAEARMMPSPPPGSTLARRRREQHVKPFGQ